MPVRVRKKRKNEKGKLWKIVEPSGKVVGQSNTRAKAQSSANARNAARQGWKPTGKKRRAKR